MPFLLRLTWQHKLDNYYSHVYIFSEEYGHFAEIIVDRNTHLGCAILRFTPPHFEYIYVYHIVCNYASVYAIDVPLYESGNPAANCQTGSHPLYRALCSLNEPFDPNY